MAYNVYCRWIDLKAELSEVILDHACGLPNLGCCLVLGVMTSCQMNYMLPDWIKFKWAMELSRICHVLSTWAYFRTCC